MVNGICRIDRQLCGCTVCIVVCVRCIVGGVPHGAECGGCEYACLCGLCRGWPIDDEKSMGKDPGHSGRYTNKINRLSERGGARNISSTVKCPVSVYYRFGGIDNK